MNLSGALIVGLAVSVLSVTESRDSTQERRRRWMLYDGESLGGADTCKAYLCLSLDDGISWTTGISIFLEHVVCVT